VVLFLYLRFPPEIAGVEFAGDVVAAGTAGGRGGDGS
jgi:hypothetical protein